MHEALIIIKILINDNRVTDIEKINILGDFNQKITDIVTTPEPIDSTKLKELVQIQKTINTNIQILQKSIIQNSKN